MRGTRPGVKAALQAAQGSGACQLCRGSALATEASAGDLYSPRRARRPRRGIMAMDSVAKISLPPPKSKANDESLSLKSNKGGCDTRRAVRSPRCFLLRALRDLRGETNLPEIPVAYRCRYTNPTCAPGSSRKPVCLTDRMGPT